MKPSSFARPAAALTAAFAFYACSGSKPSAAPAPAPAPVATSASAPAASAAAKPFTAAMVAEGDSIFHARTCKNCHGPDGKGAKNGPDLTTGRYLQSGGSYNEIIGVITSGVPVDKIKDPTHTIAMRGRGGMPPLTDDQVRSVAAYVYSLGHH